MSALEPLNDPYFEKRISEIYAVLEQTHSEYYAREWAKAVRYLHRRWILYYPALKKR